MSLATVLILIAIVLAVLAAFNVPSRVGLFPLSFAVFLLSILLAGVTLPIH